MTHMFQFYTIHWTGTIFQGLKMTGRDRPSLESRDCRLHSDAKRLHTHTQAHTLKKIVLLLLFHMKIIFPLGCQAQKCWSKWAISLPPKKNISKVSNNNAVVDGRNLINLSTINSFPIATCDKESRMKRAGDSWQGLPVEKALFSNPPPKPQSPAPLRSFTLTEEMTKSTS